MMTTATAYSPALEPRETLADLSRIHGVSESAVAALAEGLMNTGGGMVQFNIPELGGMGQWMPGMCMVGDMFNYGLKARLDSLCRDINARIGAGQLRRPAPPPPVPGAPGQASSLSGSYGWGNWWGADLGSPAASGSQNGLRYAWFPSTRRLAVDVGSGVWIYDTADHNIGGVSQQQTGAGWTLTFTSQYGVVNVASLRVVSRP
jgi:hypothetical protein